MQGGSITCLSQRFALTRCHCSAQVKKPRHRKSKEERRAMVEMFVTKFRNTNNGSFPSLNLTHKEVGGSYYIVRDIMRDIIQENRVLGPGDLNMQSLTLEDVPVQPEICENVNTSIGAELHLEAGSEEDCIVVDSVNQGSNVSLEVLENEDQNSGLSDDSSFEQIEVLDYEKDASNLIAEENCTDHVGKQPADDVLESDFHKNGDAQGSLVNVITEGMDERRIDTEMGEVDEVSETDGSLPYKIDSLVAHTEVSDSNGGFKGSMDVEKGDIQESVMEVTKKTVTESISDSEEVKGEVLDSMDLNAGLEMPRAVKNGDLKESAGEITAETTENPNSEIKKDGRGQSSEINGKMSLNENKKSISLMGSVETLGSNGGFETVRTVVEVEQFPLPRANSSLNSEKDPDCVSASAGAGETEMESVEVKVPAVVITKTETKPELEEDPNSGKSPVTVPDTEQGATLNNVNKTEGRELNPRTPINEYLLHRHESHLKLDFLTPEISMDASSNREGVKKDRAKAENNPLWNTIRAFVTAIIKFWSE